MKIIEYIGLDTSRVAGAYKKVRAAIARDDFHGAQVKKLVSHGHYYRAKLDDSNRLLFTLVRHGDTVAALMLEVIANHAYDQSRFLRGAAVDEAKIPEVSAAEASAHAEPLRYLHPQRSEVHLLDKVISFDDTQETIYRLPPPLIIVGSAGSGKTALTLEKMKHAEGEVLYVTHSAYLAQSARNLYFSHAFERAGQEANFLSYREFVESLRVPKGREATWRDFSGWFGRIQQAFRGVDGHQAFEEIRGVIAADAAGILSREAYRSLGVRQSIFAEAERDKLYDLFEKYRAWLSETGLFDLNLEAHSRLALAAPRYDFVVVDEVQDLTSVQLALVLKTLKKPGHFLLCGDSNQIVHPNFFSWSQVKTLFWRDEALAARQELQVLRANFRNGAEATRVANTLLKIKHRRFGSIDRESNFLVQAVAGEAGSVSILADKDATLKELDKQTRLSTRFAVLVMRDEDKPAAKKHFQTPLVFSIHEAKGLEYENIVLYRFISGNRAEFSEIVAGVTAADLAGDDLDYRRAKDKTDKSLEIYKFYVNALYVALTRAISKLYLVESDTRHELLRLLAVQDSGDKVQVDAKASSLEDWQKEARKLELQGKDEQAQAIRRNILKQTPVPWPVFDEARLRENLIKVFREQVPGNKQKQQLYEYATCYGEPVLVHWLREEAKFTMPPNFEKQRTTLGRKHIATYYNRNFKDILKQCEQYGVEHRTVMNLTPLMAAARAGNLPLVEALLERGADREATDHLGRNALHWAMLEAFHDAQFARGPFATLYDLIAPSFVDVMAGERLVRIDRHLTEYFLFQSMWALFKTRMVPHDYRERTAFDTTALLAALTDIPANILRPERKARQHISAVLSRNEVERDYAYNRDLFLRTERGWYQFNPKLAVRRHGPQGELWVPIFEALNLPFYSEFTWVGQWPHVHRYLELAGMAAPPTPIAAERRQARLEAEARRLREQEDARLKAAEEIRRKDAEWKQQQKAALARLRKEGAQKPAPPAPQEAPENQETKPAWGTPAAKRAELERIRREIEDRKRQDGLK